MNEFAHMSDEAMALWSLGNTVERLRRDRDHWRNKAVSLLGCAVLDLGFLVWDVVKHDPAGAVGVEAGLAAVCLGFGVWAWKDWRAARRAYDAAHASYMAALGAHQ